MRHRLRSPLQFICPPPAEACHGHSVASAMVHLPATQRAGYLQPGPVVALQLGPSAATVTQTAPVCPAGTTHVAPPEHLLAQNQVLFTFGVFAVTGEITCLVTAVLALPAALTLLGMKRT